MLEMNLAALLWPLIIAVLIGYLAYRRDEKAWLWAIIGAGVTLFAAFLPIPGLLSLVLGFAVSYGILYMVSSGPG